MRLVVIPATPLLVRAAAGRADPAAELRGVVREVLRDALDDLLPGVASGTLASGTLASGTLASGTLTGGAPASGGVVVLGTGPTTRTGRLRPTLAATGVADVLLPVVAPPRTGDAAARWDGVASTGPSVALLALADAGLDVMSGSVDVVEVRADAPDADVAEAVRSVQGDGTAERLLVVADHPGAGVDAVLATLLTTVPGEGRWTREVRDVAPGATGHEHLPSTYRVTVHRTVGP